jgi:hypothetical protein
MRAFLVSTNIMPISDHEIIRQKLSTLDVLDCIENAQAILGAIQDRSDLHARDIVERFHNILMGELAERMVMDWLHQHNKHAVSAVDKRSASPDCGHDLWVHDIHGAQRTCSVKSSIAVLKTKPADILDTFTIAINEKEAREINVQVYFWLEPHGKPRISVPTLTNSAIIAWCSRKEIETKHFQHYAGEQRRAPSIKLRALRPMHELLPLLS